MDRLDLRKMGPLTAQHPLVSDHCAACKQPFQAGDYVTLVSLGPGNDPEEQEKARDGASVYGRRPGRPLVVRDRGAIVTTTHVIFRRDRPAICSGCKQSFVPKDGPVIGLDSQRGWPMVTCPNCRATIGVGPAHVVSVTLA